MIDQLPLSIALIALAVAGWDAWRRKVALDRRKLDLDEQLAAIEAKLTALADKSARELVRQMQESIGVAAEGDPPIVERLRRLETVRPVGPRLAPWQTG